MSDSMQAMHEEALKARLKIMKDLGLDEAAAAQDDVIARAKKQHKKDLDRKKQEAAAAPPVEGLRKSKR